jgi:amino acid adenylation domain-containing protein
MAEADPSQPLDGVAIVGMAGRFPGARNCDEFWENLRAGREGLTFFSDEELAAAGLALGPHHEKRVRSRGVMDDAELFDAAFFGYSPKEAEIMDPQQRVFLEAAWTALENAGFDPDRVPGAVGVFAGAGINTYYPTNVVSRPDILGPFGVFPAVVLNEKDFLATRVAYKLNLRGPAISVQTACSTSLVAVCNACQSLLSFECDLALAGGVAINFPHCHSHIHEEGGMISADGHCRPFDKNATGTLFSDGVGVVALRRLEDAVAGGDNILAVIKGFALNNDGSDKPGFTAPSVNGQARVVQMAQAFGDVSPDTISYVEAHGTATPLGDPIEIAALTQAFRAGTEATQFCAIGSVKSNIGHLDVAAGIAGLIKTVLALQHRELPPTIHFTGQNPKIDFASTPFFVVDRLLEWKTQPGVPRRAGVSSFGIGGTNAHVVLEEAPKVSPSGPSRKYHLLSLSARSQAAVDAATANLAGHLTVHPELSLADVAYTLQTGRHQFNYRRFVVCRDRAEALAQLGAERVKDHPALVPARHNPPVVFMFPGQGAQRVNMGRELYESEPLYRETVDACARALTTDLGLDLREVLFPPPDKLSWAEEQIVQTRITQPALFVTEYALARLWMAWGIRPAAMIGHSVGEYVAACLAGVFSLDDGLRVVAARGRLIQQQPRGAMIAVMAGEEEVRPLLGEGLSIAAVNAPGLCVASGSYDAIALLEKVVGDAGKAFRRLQTSHAFHSAMMEPVVAPFTELLQGVRLSRPQLPFVSNLTAAWITDGDATSPAYWAQHLRQAVRFADGVAVVLGKADHVLLEVGPGSTLTTLARQHPSRKSTQVVVPSLLPTRRDQPSDAEGVLGAMGRLWQAGVEIDWAGFYSKESRRRVPLPSYPFERKRFFVEPGRTEYVAATVEKGSSAVVPGAEAKPDVAVVPISHRERILGRLYVRLQALSGLSAEELGLNTTFLEMGFDSLFLSQVSRALEVEFGVPITLRQVADNLSSISRLADYLETALPEDSDKGPAPASPVAAGAAVDASLLMTDAQREVWLAAQIAEDVSRTYNEAYLIRVQGPLRADVLRESLQELVNRHDALRATFAADGSGQTIASRVKAELVISSLAGCPDDAAIDRRLDDLVHAATAEPFDLAAGPLFRFSLFDLGNQRWAVLLVIHHLIADGWSWGVLLEELGEVYTAKAEGRTLPHRPALQYADYISWEGSPAQQTRVASAEAYWLELLADRPEEFELPTDRPRPSQKTYGSGRVRHAFDATLVTRLKESARNFNCTLFHLLTASFYAWIHRMTGREDLIVAVPTAGQVASGLRECSHADRLVGHCVNMLPVRLRCAGDASFRELLQHAKTRLLDARDHQDVSFNNLINKLQWPRDSSRAPLASVSLNLGRAHQVRLGTLTTDTQLPPKAFNFFDLTADVLESHDKLTVDCKFNSDLFEASTVARWLDQWERMLAAAVANPDTAIIDQDILSGAERRQLLIEWNATEREFSRDACLQQLVERQAELLPERSAVVCDGVALTYRDLDQRANRLARRLMELGVGPNVLVGLFLERGVDMVVALLGVLKAGGAYVPLDPAYPPDRVQYVLEDARAPVLITEAALLRSLGATKAEVVCLDRDAESIARFDSAPISARACANDLAYVIYTSGSTGKPKGVQIEHRAVVNFLLSMQREPGFGDEDILLAVTTLSFDIAGLELYLPLVTGGKVVIASRDEAQDSVRLMERMRESNCTMMQATPATWRALLSVGWNGSAKLKILCGGESFPRDLAQELLPRCLELWNMYGPTETTIWSTVHRILAADGPIPIGHAIANTRVYVLDTHCNLVPRGAIGELYIGGDGLARGYLGRPELTAERFVPNPFLPGERLYRTGDLARWLPDGTLECLGRIDTQVKIRGYRIELGEVETVLAQHEAVRQCVAVAYEETPGNKLLVAYFTAKDGTAPVISELRAHLKKTLPDYMVPSVFVPIDKLPLTPNGKIDRKALPPPREKRIERSEEFVLPRDPVEQTLANVWSKLLNVTRVGLHDNFFELGGHSLGAVSMLSEVKKLTGITVPLAALIEVPTIAALAERLRKEGWSPSQSSLESIRSQGAKSPIRYLKEVGALLGWRSSNN